MHKFIAYALHDEAAGSEPRTRIGHLDDRTQRITPLAFKSGCPVGNLYQVIEADECGSGIVADGEPFTIDKKYVCTTKVS